MREQRERREPRERRNSSSGGFQKRKWTPAFEAGIKEIDFKDVKTLSRFTTERGRILPRKITGLSTRQQSMIKKAIKRARQMSLLPFISYGYNQ